MNEVAVVVVDYTSSANAAAKNARYIAHREERTVGRVVGVRGLGDRYRVSGTDVAIGRLRADGVGLARPRFYRLKLTTSDEIAGRLSRLGPARSEEVLHRAARRAVQSITEGLQGVVAVHGNGGDGRPFGHPHVHVLLSPRYENGLAVSGFSADRLKSAWARAVELELPRDGARLAERMARAGAMSVRAIGVASAVERGSSGELADRDSIRRSR